MIWQSDLTFTRPFVLLSSEVLAVCRQAQLMAGSNEFSLLFSLQPAEEGIIVSLPFIVPKQKVSPTSVDYLENLAPYRKDGYLCVVHSHPFAVRTSFSRDDEQFINRNFPVSVLLNAHGDPVDVRLTLSLSETVKVTLKPPQVEVATTLPACNLEEALDLSI